MKGKYPIYHTECQNIIYWYDIPVVSGMMPNPDLIHRVSVEQPYPVERGEIKCPFCTGLGEIILVGKL